MRVAKCQKCAAEIVWVEHHKTHRLAPIDSQPSADGNILVTGDLYELVPRDEREKVLRRGFVLRKNHFATCPDAQDFKPRKNVAA
jgi:hypothetical protein